MRTPFSKPQGRHAASRDPESADEAAVPEWEQLAEEIIAARATRPRPVTIITDRAGIAAEVDACCKRGNGSS